MKRMMRLGLAAVVLGLVAWVAAPARADLLVLSYSGSFGPTSTLGGVPFGTTTPFTFQATFDTTTDLIGNNGIGVFDAVVTFDISGFGSFTSDPTGDVNVYLTDQSGPGFYSVGLTDSGLSSGIFAGFNTATPPFDADAPSPSALSDFFEIGPALPFIVSLSGGAGTSSSTTSTVSTRRRGLRQRPPSPSPLPSPRPSSQGYWAWVLHGDVGRQPERQRTTASTLRRSRDQDFAERTTRSRQQGQSGRVRGSSRRSKF